jgi:hypothetical protein
MPKLTKNGIVKGRRTPLTFTKKQRRKAKRARRKDIHLVVSSCDECGATMTPWRQRDIGSYVCARGNPGEFPTKHKNGFQFFCSERCMHEWEQRILS